MKMSRRRNERRLSLVRARALPSLVALVQLAISAGQHPRAALAMMTRSVRGGGFEVLIEDLAPVIHRLELGVEFSEAMDSLPVLSRGASSTRRVLGLIGRSEIDGGDLSLHLELVIHDLRRERAAVLDAAAQRLTIALLFPLVLCILPAFVLLAIAPLVLEVIAELPR